MAEMQGSDSAFLVLAQEIDRGSKLENYFQKQYRNEDSNDI